MTTPRRALLLQAADVIDGDRNDTYGGPESSFKTIATLWNEYLRVVTTIPGDALQPHDVAAMLALLKIARIAGSGGTHKDSWLDLAGYAACGWEVVDVPVPADRQPPIEEGLERLQDYVARQREIQPLRHSIKDINAALDAMQPIGPGTVGWQGVK